MEGNSISGVEKHVTEKIDEKYTEEEIKVLKKLGLDTEDIKSKK